MPAHEAHLRWFGKLGFQATSHGHQVLMDAAKLSGGQDIAMNPKELALSALTGCTAMDVISLLAGKGRKNIVSFEIKAATEQTDSHPKMWKSVHLVYEISGDVTAEEAMNAVTLSMTKYCGVSAMISKAAPITYDVVVNGEDAGSGEARFP